MDRSSISHDSPHLTHAPQLVTTQRPSPNVSTSKATSHGSSNVFTDQSIRDTLLSDYANHIDPLDINGGTRLISDPAPKLTEDLASGPSPVSPIETPISAKKSNPSASLAPVRVPPAFPYRTHRKSAHSLDMPQQTIMKALASRSGSQGGPAPLTAPLANALSDLKLNDADKDQPSPASCITATLAGLHANGPPSLSPMSNWLLKSPCFFHQRLEGSIDVQKLIEDIADEDFTHSRLMQTATAVRESARHLQRRPLRQAVRTVMIVTKARDNNLVQLTRELAEWLLSTPRYSSELGVKVYVDAKLRHSRRFDAPGLLRKDKRYEQMLRYWTPDLCWSNPEIFDLVLTLGGDGTVLFTSWLFQRIVPPILSFSMGSLGFLTNFAFTDYKAILNGAMGDQGMRINLRMRFTCTVWRAEAAATNPGDQTTSQPSSSTSAAPPHTSTSSSTLHKTSTNQSNPLGAAVEGEQFEVLNELVIDRGPSPYVSNLELWENDHLLTIIQADGCIFSTPTGSTAYSLSAGGALVSPEIPAVLLTPICPHTLSFRPMLLSDAVALRIVVPARSRASVYCSFDGRGRIELKRGDYVTLEASQYPFPTVMQGRNEWIESVQRKLMWNTREVVQRGWGELDGGVALDGVERRGEQQPGEVEDEAWDIDTDSSAYAYEAVLDSGLGRSEDGHEGRDGHANPTPGLGVAGAGNGLVGASGTASPMRRGPSLLDLPG